MQLRVLSERDSGSIHEAALKVLEINGVWFRDSTRELLRKLVERG